MSNGDLLHISVASDARCQITLRGEADISGVTRLTTALGAINLRPGQQVHVDVGELGFIDLSCLRALIRFGFRAQQVGVAVEVDGANHEFRMIHHVVDPGVLHLTNSDVQT